MIQSFPNVEGKRRDPQGSTPVLRTDACTVIRGSSVSVSLSRTSYFTVYPYPSGPSWFYVCTRTSSETLSPRRSRSTGSTPGLWLMSHHGKGLRTGCFITYFVFQKHLSDLRHHQKMCCFLLTLLVECSGWPWSREKFFRIHWVVGSVMPIDTHAEWMWVLLPCPHRWYRPSSQRCVSSQIQRLPSQYTRTYIQFSNKHKFRLYVKITLLETNLLTLHFF